MFHLLFRSNIFISGWEVPFCDSQGGCLARDWCPKKLHYGNYLQWIQPRNIQSMYVCFTDLKFVKF